jgi:hypothetical protein
MLFPVLGFALGRTIMSYSRLVAMIITVGGLGAFLPQTQAQIAAEPDKKQAEAFQKIQILLDERLVETKQFQKEMPLAKFLEAVEKQLPKGKKMALRIDKEAFGDKLAEVAATPMKLPANPKKTSLRRVLELAIAAIKTKTDYRIAAGEVAITIPSRALHTVIYDIRDLLEKPEIFSYSAPNQARKILQLRQGDPAQKAGLVVQSFVAAIDGFGEKPATAEHDTIEILNGTRLRINASAARHAQIDDMLQAYRRIGDLAVSMQVNLYEVDAAIYQRVAKSRRLTREELEEEERQFLKGLPTIPPPDGKKCPPDLQEKKVDPPKPESLFKLLEKQKLVLAGEAVKVDNGLQAAMLSWHKAVTCLPSPAQVLKLEKGRQTVMEGVTILGAVHVSADRRYVVVKITEKTSQLLAIDKVKVWNPRVLEQKEPEKEALAEIPFLKETTLTETREIPDGGTILLPVQYRPAAAKDKNRWWILTITPRIIIEEEERLIRMGRP